MLVDAKALCVVMRPTFGPKTFLSKRKSRAEAPVVAPRYDRTATGGAEFRSA